MSSLRRAAGTAPGREVNAILANGATTGMTAPGLVRLRKFRSRRNDVGSAPRRVRYPTRCRVWDCACSIPATVAWLRRADRRPSRTRARRPRAPRERRRKVSVWTRLASNCPRPRCDPTGKMEAPTALGEPPALKLSTRTFRGTAGIPILPPRVRLCLLRCPPKPLPVHSAFTASAADAAGPATTAARPAAAVFVISVTIPQISVNATRPTRSTASALSRSRPPERRYPTSRRELCRVPKRSSW